MQLFTDPIYLRTIHDSLVTGFVNKDNASALPYGLVGVYEEAMPPLTNAADRQNFNEFFAVWALLKKEMSAAFVAEILGTTENEVLDFISKYSAWFNSPEIGKYQLYHERMRVYLLQKMGNEAIRALNLQLTSYIEKSLLEKTLGELEVYGLEYFTEHLAVEAMLTGDGQQLLQWAFSSTYWERQLKISKEYKWTKKGLQIVMNWASKYNNDKLIECCLHVIDLRYQIQNSVSEIIALVTEGDIETALNRIQSFGRADAEGVKRGFILYMLCLAEFTLLGGKAKPHRRAGIEKMLNHLEEQMPTDHSVLNWNNFFPSYLIFQMACEWSELGLDYLIVYKRTDDWEQDWITEKGPFSSLQFGVLQACARGISSDSRKSSALRDISAELAKQGHEEEAASSMQEALACARGISDEFEKIRALRDISAELAKQGHVEEAASSMQEALACARGISDEYWKSSALRDISAELAKQGHVEEAEAIGLEIPRMAERHECWKNHAVASLSKNTWRLALSGVQEYKIDEARLFFLKGWCENVAVKDVSAECVAAALPFIANDSESIETLLQKYALQETLLGRAKSAMQQRLNRSLNIQWAIDIAAHFSKEETNARLSTNLDSWLQQIADEDDREQIALWAKQVAKGKISEEEFAERIVGK